MLATVAFSQASQLRKLDLAHTGTICQTGGLTYGETTYIHYFVVAIASGQAESRVWPNLNNIYERVFLSRRRSQAM